MCRSSLRVAAAAPAVVPLRRRRPRAAPAVRAAAGGAGGDVAPAKHVLIVGGTGRVGRSTAAALAACGTPLRLTLAGRDAARFREATASEPLLRDAVFAQLDVEDAASLAAALRGADLVVHAAGPFQRQPRCPVLEAAIAARVPYLDVADDTAYAQRAQALHPAAQAADIRAVVCGGMFPGVSNLMAASLVRAAATGEATPPTPTRVTYSYFTAGSGGAGTTILATSILLCGEEVVAYKDGAAVRVPPVTGRRVIDFGQARATRALRALPHGSAHRLTPARPRARAPAQRVGKREVFLYNLPEVATTHSTLGAPNVAARFGTSPGIWNGAMATMARLLPPATLQDRAAAQSLARALEPLVRAVDALVGELTAMRVDVELSDGKAVSSLFVHKRLSVSVGHCVAAFARDLLEHPAGPDAPAGVYFPEAASGVADAELLLRRAATGTLDWQQNRAGWQLESRSRQLGFGLYLD
jgi:short subunit dehydrogenase-like uncharacterized protein